MGDKIQTTTSVAAMYKWDRRFMELARHISTWSRDHGRKNGAVIVGPSREVRAMGYNGFPRGVDDEVESRYTRPVKYFFTEHSERNALYNAARTGLSVEGCIMYTTLFPCVDCARGIIQSGISLVVAPQPDLNDSKYGEEFGISITMLAEAGVQTRLINANWESE